MYDFKVANNSKVYLLTTEYRQTDQKYILMQIKTNGIYQVLLQYQMWNRLEL